MNRYLEKNLFINTYWEKHSRKHPLDRQHGIKRINNKTGRRKNDSRAESFVWWVPQTEQDQIIPQHPLGPHLVMSAEVKPVNMQLWKMKSFIYPEPPCVSSGVSSFLRLFVSLPQPWPERTSCRGEDVVYSPWYRRMASCRGCEWQSGRGAGSVCSGDVCPLGAGRRPAPHLTEVTEDLTSGNNFQSLQMCAVVEPVTTAFSLKLSILFQIPLPSHFNPSQSFLNAHCFLHCVPYLIISLLKCCTSGWFVLLVFLV